MKTRSNMPLFVVECEDVKALSNAQIDLLRCGDYLVKKDASGEHAYKVTFKSDTGMCITYMDASVIETQSYDKIDGVWTYNSEDKTPNLLEVVTDVDVVDAISGEDIAPKDVTASGDITANSIIENMSGYSFIPTTIEGLNFDYVGAVKNGNKLTLVVACSVNVDTSLGNPNIGYFKVPTEVANKIINSTLAGSPVAYEKYIQAFKNVTGSPVNLSCRIYKDGSDNINVIIYGGSQLELNTDYIFRIETTFLLSDNLVD